MRLKLFKRLLACLIALVLPIQGIAAVVAGQCLALAGDAAAMRAGRLGDRHAEAASHATAGHGHDEAAAHPHDDFSAPVPAGDDSAAHPCGPCTACCTSASIAGPVAVFAIPQTGIDAPAFLPRPPRPVHLAALDRPPPLPL